MAKSGEFPRKLEVRFEKAAFFTFQPL